jgi:hypothetical protein
LGDLERAEEFTNRALQIAETAATHGFQAALLIQAATVRWCRGSSEKAAEALEKARQICRAAGLSGGEAWATGVLGRLYLARGEREASLRWFRDSLALAGQDTYRLADVLSGLEEAFEDPEAFRAFCCRVREEGREGGPASLVQWFLEPAEPCATGQPEATVPASDASLTSLSAEWVWYDPLGDCSFVCQHGLEIHAANGRDLRFLNLSAPRHLRPAPQEFAVQTVCARVLAERPAIGGILIWKDRQNFLRLDRGTRGEHEISFTGCLQNRDLVIGRGRLPAERVFLRLERRGDRVNALCSADGESWFTVGAVDFPVAGPLEVGLHAIGAIDRTIYPGAYPDGTAIRFEAFEAWTRREEKG